MSKDIVLMFGTAPYYIVPLVIASVVFLFSLISALKPTGRRHSVPQNVRAAVTSVMLPPSIATRAAPTKRRLV